MTTVELRPLRIDDVSWIHDACQDREIQRWTQVPRPYRLAHAIGFVEGATGEYQRWVIVSKESDTPVGVVSIHEVKDSTARVGYWVAREHRGRSFTVEALQLIGEELRTRRTNGEIDVESVVALIAADNSSSRSVVEQVGFRLSETRQGPAVEDLVPVLTCVYVWNV